MYVLLFHKYLQNSFSCFLQISNDKFIFIKRYLFDVKTNFVYIMRLHALLGHIVSLTLVNVNCVCFIDVDWRRLENISDEQC